MADLEMPIRSYSEDRFTWAKFFRDAVFFGALFGAAMYVADLAIFGGKGGPPMKWQIWGYLGYGLFMAMVMRHQYSVYVRLYKDRIVGNAAWGRNDLARQSVGSIRETTLGTLWYRRRGLLVSHWRRPWLTKLFGACVFVPASAPDYEEWKSELANWPGASLSRQ